MHVMETGRGRPVLMVHGNPTWGFLYRKVAMCLQGQGLRLIMPDLIGFGLSDKPRDFAAHTIRNHSKWLGSLIDQLDLHDVTLVCQDWGGAIGVHPFTTRQDRLGAMVVLNTVLDAPPPGFKPTAFHRFSHMPLVSDFVFRVLPLPQAALHLAQGDKSSIRGNVARAYRYPFRQFATGWPRWRPLAWRSIAMGHPSIPALEECAAFVRQLRWPQGHGLGPPGSHHRPRPEAHQSSPRRSARDRDAGRPFPAGRSARRDRRGRSGRQRQAKPRFDAGREEAGVATPETAPPVRLCDGIVPPSQVTNPK